MSILTRKSPYLWPMKTVDHFQFEPRPAPVLWGAKGANTFCYGSRVLAIHCPDNTINGVDVGIHDVVGAKVGWCWDLMRYFCCRARFSLASPCATIRALLCHPEVELLAIEAFFLCGLCHIFFHLGYKLLNCLRFRRVTPSFVVRGQMSKGMYRILMS